MDLNGGTQEKSTTSPPPPIGSREDKCLSKVIKYPKSNEGSTAMEMSFGAKIHLRGTSAAS